VNKVPLMLTLKTRSTLASVIAPRGWKIAHVGEENIEAPVALLDRGEEHIEIGKIRDVAGDPRCLAADRLDGRIELCMDRGARRLAARTGSKCDGDRLIVIAAFWDAALQAKQLGLAG